MRTLILLALVGFAIAKLFVDPAAPDVVRKAQQEAVKEQAAGKPVPLTDAIWRTALSEGNWMVEFYAPWCGHCKKLAPVWEDLASRAQNHRSSGDPSKHFNVAKIDCSANEDACHSFGVVGYPTIKYVREGSSVYDFGGFRSADNLDKFAITGYVAVDNEGFPYENQFLNELRLFKNEAVLIFPDIYADIQKWVRERILAVSSSIFLIIFTVAFIAGRLTGPENLHAVRPRNAAADSRSMERAVVRIQAAYRGHKVRSDPANSPQKAKSPEGAKSGKGAKETSENSPSGAKSGAKKGKGAKEGKGAKATQ